MLQFVKMLVFLLGIASFSFAGGPVSVYGALKACTIGGKGRICGSGLYANTAVQVKGISLGWSNTGWESAAFFNANTVNALVDGWKAEVIRVPIGYSEGGGYKSDASNLTRVKTAIEAALAKDVYVVIDWHSHSAHNETDAAKKFFEDMIQAYGANNDRIIYEIYNEPTVTPAQWSTVKTYADNIISAIRAKGANNLILVGTPEYSARPNAADGNYLSDPNVAYVFHFYAAYHKLNMYSAGITTVLNAGKPIFASEYGTVMNTGNGKHDAASTNEWYKFMDDNGISSCAWQVSYKNETSALFVTSFTNPDNKSLADFTNKSNMKESGQFIYEMLIANAKTAPWLNSPLQPSSSSSVPSSSSVAASSSSSSNVVSSSSNNVSSSSSDVSSSSSNGSTPIVLPQLVKNLENNATIQIFDLKGNRVEQLADLPKGLYIIKVTSASLKQTFKVVVK